MSEDNFPLLTKEKMIKFVKDKIQEGVKEFKCHERTKEDIQSRRQAFFNQCDEATIYQLEEIKKNGVEVSEMKLTAEFHFDKKLGVWKLDDIHSNFGLKLPHSIKRLVLRYDIDKKF